MPLDTIATADIPWQGDVSGPIPDFPDIAPIRRVGNVSREAIQRDFVEQQRPVIIQGKMSGWRACREWSPDAFKASFGDAVVHASIEIPDKSTSGFQYWGSESRWMPLAEFVDTMATASRPCYVRQAPHDRIPGFAECFDFGDFIDMTGRNAGVGLWFGSAGTDSGLHWDTQSNFLAQIYGSKRVLLCPPEDSAHLYAHADQIRWSRFDALDPDFAAFPRAKRAHPLIGVVHPGEAIHIPRGWWHQFVSLDVSISLNCFFEPSCSLGYFLRRALGAGPAHAPLLALDFIRLGLLKMPYKHRILTDVPTGLFVYNIVTDAIRRRLAGNRES